MEESDRPQSMGSQRVKYDWAQHNMPVLEFLEQTLFLEREGAIPGALLLCLEG